ncbi:hypothetical protein DM860_016364 [Cuscuta australis]|uniref:Uncharacterized protein n=1 Tax=Cuscuta australis TaxID=267555 RepID=A0A328DCK3_9ASTE|nr:hypothetical protein DM860_016364 [Cuscuta australis]
MLCYQEFQERKEESQEEDGSSRFIDSGAIDYLSLLHLNSAAKRRPAAITAENGTSSAASAKRPSPTFVSSLPEPSPKRPTLLPPSSSFSPPANGAGATKPQPSFLYRSFSEPIDTTGLLNARSAENSKMEDFGPVSASGGFLSPSPGISQTTGPSFKTPSPPMNSDFLPPLHPLCRSISDPFAATDFQAPQVAAATAATPPKRPVWPQTIKTSPPSSAEESPSTKRLQAKMKAGMRKMRQWCDQLMQEVVKDEKEETPNPRENEKGTEEEEEKGSESVWVEKAGEGLVIHFKCPCKKGYEILLAGNNCYYKLI